MRIVQLGELAGRPVNGPLPIGITVTCESCKSTLVVDEEDQIVFPQTVNDQGGWSILVWDVVCPQCKVTVRVRENLVREYLLAPLVEEEKEKTKKRIPRRGRGWLI